MAALSLVTTLGCETRKDRERKAAEQQSQRLEDHRTTLADQLDQRMRFYQALEGNFEGTYEGLEGQKPLIRARFTAVNVPTENIFGLAAEALQARLDKLSLEVEIEEFVTTPGKRVKAIACDATDIKPDIRSGIARIACGGGKRTYFFGVDQNGPEVSGDEEALKARSRALALDLIQNKVGTIEALNLRIRDNAELTGKLYRP